MSLNTINARLDLVTYFRDDNALRERITALLKRSYDSQRLVQKFSMGRGDPDDLISLLRTIEATNEVARTLKERIPFPGVSKPATDKDIARFQALLNLSRRFSLDEPNLLALRISETIDEEGLTQSRRLEEYESADMVSLARGVLLDEGSINDQGALSRITKSKAISKAPGEQDPEDEETWMMRKR